MEKHKGNHSRARVYIGDKTQVDFHKSFTSIFPAYTISIVKILLKTNRQDVYKTNRLSYLKRSQFVLYQHRIISVGFRLDLYMLIKHSCSSYK